MRCECNRPVRIIADRTKPSERFDIPQETCGHTSGFIYLFPSAPAEDGLCDACNWELNKAPKKRYNYE